MVVHRVKINDVVYGNVGKIESSSREVPYHDVETLDGKKHKEIRYVKTDQTVLFFNLLDGVYISLREFIKSNRGVAITCGFPDDADGFIDSEYYLTIQNEINKGYLNGNYFRNGLEVLFEKVNADE